MDNILDSYLVKLGATVDTSSFVKFNAVLKTSESGVASFTSGALNSFLKFEFGTISTLTSIGLGLVGLADKTAMADQQYRLFGMRMLMTKDSARAMQMALGQLDASLDEVSFDKELNARFQYLYEQNIKLGKTLGPTFDKNMIAIRGLRTELKFMGDEVEVLAMGSISKLFEKLGFSSGQALNKLTEYGNEIIEKIPGWADKISNYLVPAWNNAVTVTKELGSEFKIAAGDFTFLVGKLMGDDSIKTTTFDLNNMAKAMGDVLDRATGMVLLTGLGLRSGEHFAKAFAHMMLLNPLSSEEEQKKQGNAASREADALAYNTYSLFSGDIDKNPDFGSIKEWMGMNPKGKTLSNPSIQTALTNPDFQRLLHGIAQVESGDRQFDINGKPTSGPANSTGEIALGRYQLLPSTAKKYGVDANTEEGNTLGAAMYLRDLLNKHKGSVHDALAEYGGFKTKSPEDYINRVEKFGSDYNPNTSSNSVTITGLTIVVPHSIPQDQMHRFVKDSMTDIIGKANKNTIAQTAAGAYQ